MQIVNRGFLIIRQQKPFLDWSNLQDPEIQFSENDEVEPTVFLIEEDFFDIEPILEKNFKKIFKHELTMVNEDETSWPQTINMETFLDWFSVDYGAMTFDLEKTDLKRDKV